MGRPLNIQLIVSCFGFIVFLVFALGAGIAQSWLLFLVGLVLTAVAAGFVLITGERWKPSRGNDSARSRYRSRRR
ncbi:hypothetical protein GCM10009525_26610 [Streptosporangium amethystogenes subsp. fukuiense]